MIASNEVWGPAGIEPGSEIERVVGSLILRVRRPPGEVWVHGAHDGAPPPLHEEWTRWSVSEDDRLELRPSLPDRLVVVSPEQPFYLPPHASANVFVRVPLVVRLVRSDRSEDETDLAAYPCQVLSDTWWGSFTDGEVAYWLTTKARRAAPPDIFEPHLAVCPLILSNGSDEPLPIDRFGVRVAHLTLFRKGAAMWTDEVQVRYEGAPEGSEVRYTGRVPAEVGEARLIAAPRVPPPKGLHSRTFGRLLALSGL